MAGTKETEELIKGLAALAHAVIVQIKDGVQIKDLPEFFQKVLEDGELSASLVAAFEGIAQVPVEAADLNWIEGIKLGRLVLAEVKSVAGEIK